LPKMKTKRGAAKRFRVTGSGKIVRRKAWGAHLFKSKSKARQVRLKGNDEVVGSDRRRVRKMLGG
jgi:large subunit ribosomal protein L35